MSLNEIIKTTKYNNYVDLGYIVYVGYNESWKQASINGKKARQYVSSLGRVYDPKYDRLCTISISKYGYCIISLNIGGSSDRYRLNRVVLETFKGKPPKNMVIPESDHIDGNKLDNSIYNLQWLSKTNNVKKEMRDRDVKGENNPYSSYTEEDIHSVCKLIESNQYTLKEIANMTNVTIDTVYDIKQQRCWKHITLKYNFSQFNKYDENFDRSVAEKMNEMIRKGKSNKEIIKALKLVPGIKTTQILSSHRKRLGCNVKQRFNITEEQKVIVDREVMTEKTVKEILTLAGLEYTTKSRAYISNRRFKLNRR